MSHKANRMLGERMQTNELCDEERMATKGGGGYPDLQPLQQQASNNSRFPPATDRARPRSGASTRPPVQPAAASSVRFEEPPPHEKFSSWGFEAAVASSSPNQRPSSRDGASAADYYRARSPGRGSRRGEEDERARSPDAEAAHKRSSNRAAARWAALENESDDEDDDDAEVELDDLRQQVKARVKDAAWGRKAEGIGVPALERRLSGFGER